mmetsp:Transcript_89784/g.141783  ORF Transcript_89784/g.141783 Transcript_89784/m.141783 type:complete len:187 (+) Transcript_89784:91-651(+)
MAFLGRAMALTAFTTLVPAFAKDPLYIATLCRDQTCENGDFPLIDYDENTGSCMCSKHPCWDDNGQVHSCLTEAFPHLAYIYDHEGKLQCRCDAKPQYLSTYIARVKCSGHRCDDDTFSQLDFDPDQNQCVCSKHPCEDLNGQKHECSNPEFPILSYREEGASDGNPKQICECKRRIQDATAHSEM